MPERFKQCPHLHIGPTQNICLYAGLDVGKRDSAVITPVHTCPVRDRVTNCKQIDPLIVVPSRRVGEGEIIVLSDRLGGNSGEGDPHQESRRLK